LTQTLRNFLGNEQSVKLTEELLQDFQNRPILTFQVDMSFDFKVKPIDQDDGQMWVEVYILPGGTVDSILTGNGISDLKTLTTNPLDGKLKMKLRKLLMKFLQKKLPRLVLSVDVEKFLFRIEYI